MLTFPKVTHRLHQFEHEGKQFIVDFDCYGKTVETDPLISEILRLCPDHDEEQIITRLSAQFKRAEILQAISELDMLAAEGILFSDKVDGRDDASSPTHKPKIFIPQIASDWFSSIDRRADETDTERLHIIKALAKYAEVHVTGERVGQIDHGIYQAPFDLSKKTSLHWPFKDYHGILAFPLTGSYDLLPLFDFAETPIVVQNDMTKAQRNDVVNWVLLHYSAMRDFDACVIPSASVAEFYSRFIPDTSLFHTMTQGDDPNCHGVAKKILALFAELHRKKAWIKQGHFSVLFAKDWDGTQQRIREKSILLNVNQREENPLFIGAYTLPVETGLALTLLRRHSSRELEALLSSVTQDRAKVLNIMNRVKGFANAVA